MKTRRFLTFVLILATVTAMLTGCGGASMDMPKTEAAVEAPAAMDMAVAEDGLYSASASVAGSGSAAETNTQQKLITTVYIDAETEDLDPFLEQIGGKISALGGYVEQQDVYNGSSRSTHRYRSASMTVRIPAQNLAGFVEQVKDSANVVSYNESQEDVTLTYVSTETRVKALEAQEARLLELMEQAENMTELLEIDARLSEVRYELENVASRLRVLSNQVDYATVHLNIEQVKVYTEVEEQTVWQRIGSGFEKNLKNIGEDLVDFFVWAVTYSPQLVIFAVIVIAVILIIRRGAGRRTARKANPLNMPPYAEPPKDPENKA